MIRVSTPKDLHFALGCATIGEVVCEKWKVTTILRPFVWSFSPKWARYISPPWPPLLLHLWLSFFCTIFAVCVRVSVCVCVFGPKKMRMQKLSSFHFRHYSSNGIQPHCGGIIKYHNLLTCLCTKPFEQMMMIIVQGNYIFPQCHGCLNKTFWRQRNWRTWQFIISTLITACSCQ